MPSGAYKYHPKYNWVLFVFGGFDLWLFWHCVVLLKETGKKARSSHTYWTSGNAAAQTIHYLFWFGDFSNWVLRAPSELWQSWFMDNTWVVKHTLVVRAFLTFFLEESCSIGSPPLIWGGGVRMEGVWPLAGGSLYFHIFHLLRGGVGGTSGFLVNWIFCFGVFELLLLFP